MKIICLKGGLGNQIFEYGRYLKIKESHQSAYIYYDKRRLKQHQNLMINDVFDITLPKEPLWVTCLVWTCKILRHLNLFKTLYNEEKESAILIDDYSQSKEYAYFTTETLAFHHDIKHNPYTTAYMSIIDQSEYPVALHVRRGDYLLKENKENFGLCPLSYYQKAKEYILSQQPNATFLVFSDDLDWCKRHLQASHTIFVDIPQNVPDSISLYLMTQCAGHIIANSTFSFWGAKLCTQANGINIYPDQWFANPNWNIPNFIPSNWIKKSK